MVRMEIYAFVMDLNGTVSIRVYHPTLPVSIYCYRDEKTRKYNINKTFDIWMLNFSSYFATNKPKVLMKFYNYIQREKSKMNYISFLV